jgi:MFS family permease
LRRLSALRFGILGANVSEAGHRSEAGMVENRQRRVPAVVMDMGAGAACRCIEIDALSGAKAAANHLLDLGHGRFAIMARMRSAGRPIYHRSAKSHPLRRASAQALFEPAYKYYLSYCSNKLPASRCEATMALVSFGALGVAAGGRSLGAVNAFPVRNNNTATGCHLRLFGAAVLAAREGLSAPMSNVPVSDIEQHVAQSPKAHFGFTFVLPLALGSTLNPINSTMISTALAPIATDFHSTVAETGWVVAGLYLTSAVAQPTMGRLADLFGSRRVYLISLVLVGLAGLGGLLAPSLGALVAARVLLGIGTSGAYPSAMRIFRSQADLLGAPPPRMAMGVLSLAAISTQALGPVLGGLITGGFGWHGIFTVNVPLALVTALLVWLWVPRDSHRAASLADLTREIDLSGVILFAAALLSLMLFLMNLDRPMWWVLPLSGLLWVLFWFHSLRCQQPFIDVRMFSTNIPLTVTLLRVTVILLIPYCIIYGFAQWLETSAHYSPSAAGLVTLPMSIMAAACSLLGARSKGIRAPFIVGAFGGLVGCVSLVFVHSTTPVWLIAAAVMLIGVPMGLTASPTQTAIFLQAPASEMGVAAGLQRTFSYFGAIGATSLLGVMFGHHATDEGFHALAMLMTAVAGFLLVFILLDRTLPHGSVG